MLKGVRFKANPTPAQKHILSQWMGCARFIWNAKCNEEHYYSTFARKYHPIGTYAPIDQKTSHFKSKELTPFLYECPSQIIRNSAVNWYQTFQKFMKGLCGKPKRKAKRDRGSIHLTRELFHFKQCANGVVRLFIGTKTNNIGYLSFKAHRPYAIPNSLYIKKEQGRYTVSFCYDDGIEISETKTDSLKALQTCSRNQLNEQIVGIDRGVAVSVQAGDSSFNFTQEQKRRKDKKMRQQKRLQKRMARQLKASNRRKRTKQRLAKTCAKVANIRRNFCHKTSRSLINSPFQVFVFEDLNVAKMTRRPKKKQDDKGRFVSNKAAQKAGLNRAILDKGWHQLEIFTIYKARKMGKAVYKVAANFTSQECANCGHIHPDNRTSQADFCCVHCGHIDNADRNASIVIKKRAIDLILDTGTVLSERGVLRAADIGRGAKDKTRERENRLGAIGNEASKKMRIDAVLIAA